ncbi:protein kinase [Stieleria sp. ICT_E10.1]|uniref:serine/threonine protein kinase n=1 Tax=Stieleria sedimenti TaxID=2976331 RepID=UPI00217F73B2|nr:serine/threonine-protein kinase [Stieleria sedimenti]MCS7470185.1 protein kinase [Stieleria sedimenti]
MMARSTRYCQRCNEKYDVAPTEVICPQCGNRLSDWIDGSTVDLDQTNQLEFLVEDQEPAEELVGQPFANYQIEGFLGQGGMARVYLATHRSLQRPCAVKVLRPSTLQQGDRAIESFLSEARLSAAINHPHAVTLYTLGHSDGRDFLEMEYVDGKSLERLVLEQGKLNPLQATTWMFQVSSALAVAHDLGMIHRDIKPANVMVTKTQIAKLADFGLAKQIANDQPLVGEVLSGTPNYMAPELFRGHAASIQSDIYAMGVTYFYLLTGRLAVDTSSIGELVRFHSKHDLLRLLDFEAERLPAGIANVMKKSLGREVSQRYGHACELRDDLRAVLGGLRSLESMLTEALAGSSMLPEFDGQRYHVRVTLPDGRNQIVSVELDEDAETHEEIVRVFSICGPASASYYERALHLNAAMSHGAIGIESVSGIPHFVMVNSYPRATCDAHEIRTSIAEVAKYADHVEDLLTGEDHF